MFVLFWYRKISYPDNMSWYVNQGFGGKGRDLYTGIIQKLRRIRSVKGPQLANQETHTVKVMAQPERKRRI